MGKTDIIERLETLRDKVDTLKGKVQRLEGEQEALRKRLKDEFGADTLEEAKEKLGALGRKADKLDSDLQAAVGSLAAEIKKAEERSC